jgi:hypothetical protein
LRSSAEPEEGGLASGIVNTSYQVRSALGLAVMTAVATSQRADRLGDVTALTDGYSAALIGAAASPSSARCSPPSCCACRRAPRRRQTTSRSTSASSRSRPDRYKGPVCGALVTHRAPRDY